MRKRKTPQQRLRDKAEALANDLDDAARDMLSGRSFAATQLRKAAKLLHALAEAWQDADPDVPLEDRDGRMIKRGVTKKFITTKQRVKNRKR